MSETPATPERTETGTIVDQTKPVESKTPTTETTKPEAKATESATADKPSVLNEKVPEGAPKEYEAFKVPEGYELDGEVAKEAGGLFKGMNLSQTDAQKLVDFYVAKTQEANDAPYKVWEQKQEEWRNEVARDPDIGGKLQQVKTSVSRMIDSLDPALARDFRSAMDYTGAGNNPAFIKAMYKLAQMLGEGEHVSGRAPSEHGQRAPGSRPESAAKAMYPNLP